MPDLQWPPGRMLVRSVTKSHDEGMRSSITLDIHIQFIAIRRRWAQVFGNESSVHVH